MTTTTGTVDLGAGDIPVMTIEVGAITGNSTTGFSATYETTLLHAIDHPLNNMEDQLAVNFGVTINDGQLDSLTTQFSVIVEDDRPTLAEGTVSVPVEPVNSNVMIVLDTSGSMNDSSGVAKPGGGTYTRLQVAKQAINKLLDGYDDLGDVKVQLITFAGTADRNPGPIDNRWLTVSEAKSIVGGLSANGSTDYDAALASAKLGFSETGKLGNATNYSYFLTDGEPNQGGGITGSEIADWTNWLDTQSIKSYALGLGTNVNISKIDPIAYNGITQVDDNALAKIVSNLNQLDSILQGTLPPAISKNLMKGDLSTSDSGYGADGGALYDITIDQTVYQYDRINNDMLVNNVPVDIATYDPATFEFTVETALNGVLTVNVITGDYTYQAASTPASYQEVIAFTVQDNDGDLVSSSQTLDVYPKGDGITLLGTENADTLIGRALADDVISGAGGDDIIQGRSGNDTLTGGTGNDLFVWRADDKGSVANPDFDIITDLTSGDKIVLRDLLVGETIGNLDSMKEFVNWDSVTGILHISSNGGYTDGVYDGSKTDLNIQLDSYTSSNVDDLINNYII
ncbi:VWA domain-containing protein [Psychrobacter sp. DAB_AL43B]|uniref:VWA domain-containing protein n=1 Tax=Psychrobacter sp. DAB_AL43B TaxID=1028416 RepID=UPI0009A70BD8|nr:VWA domain-containing protein [Psychrobacter sp. DAB_AL43B]SLJ84791.1 outer membrane adhesin-like protein [Psychrobacter sp. DAB_AL43B]